MIRVCGEFDGVSVLGVETSEMLHAGGFRVGVGAFDGASCEPKCGLRVALKFCSSIGVGQVAVGPMVCETRSAERGLAVRAEIDVGEAESVVAGKARRLGRCGAFRTGCQRGHRLRG